MYYTTVFLITLHYMNYMKTNRRYTPISTFPSCVNYISFFFCLPQVISTLYIYTYTFINLALNKISLSIFGTLVFFAIYQTPSSLVSHKDVYNLPTQCDYWQRNSYSSNNYLVPTRTSFCAICMYIMITLPRGWLSDECHSTDVILFKFGTM